jgi:hypothetical protein
VVWPYCLGQACCLILLYCIHSCFYNTPPNNLLGHILFREHQGEEWNGLDVSLLLSALLISSSKASFFFGKPPTGNSVNIIHNNFLKQVQYHFLSYTVFRYLYYCFLNNLIKHRSYFMCDCKLELHNHIVFCTCPKNCT